MMRDSVSISNPEVRGQVFERGGAECGDCPLGSRRRKEGREEVLCLGQTLVIMVLHSNLFSNIYIDVVAALGALSGTDFGGRASFEESRWFRIRNIDTRQTSNYNV
ncbi:hypothetical protein PoB_004759700 [Plakobranchus ocellatus]|uniref:Uncharacterized protein n=1 Tax=Plakobranchus ocellatus TaxID=259542 RepID=A0AAV4BQ49_9GAST|nr:hypothetical protein PoB_004759700 [Plakobranchus ocellatus]